jgi:hypothetical protein
LWHVPLTSVKKYKKHLKDKDDVKKIARTKLPSHEPTGGRSSIGDSIGFSLCSHPKA